MTGPLKLKIIACGVFGDELRAVAERSPNAIELHLLDAGLHAAPERLRLSAQEAIDEAARDGGYDAVCFAYGLCGRGTAGLIARGTPLVIPRVHDCIALFLGSARAYQEQFARHPGTFYFTTGWYKHKAHPEKTRMMAARRFDPTLHPHYGDLSRRFGEDNARYVVEFFESWRRNYQRAALIDHGFASPEHEQTTRAVAEAAGWNYERLEGSMELLEALAAGDWDEERFLVAPPGYMLVASNDERLFEAVALTGKGEGAVAVARAGPAEAGAYVYGEEPEHAPEADVGLGIDAGGTYTDAVLYEFAAGRVLDKAKSLTTHHNVVEGIAASVGELDAALLGRVGSVCLSTTLATNAIVEGRGEPVGLLLMPYHEQSARRVKTPLVRCLGARMNIEGLAETPVDEAEAVEAARALAAQGAAAFAVSGYGSVRNPAHELEVAGILRRHFELPIVCGHELSVKLGFVARAHTAVLNARLLPLVKGLLGAVEQVLEQAGIDAPLFVVRGDGSIMYKDVARERAIETVLSGPAASAAGGRHLTGCRDALVIDMGGTTTDVAALRDGRLALSAEGARVGHWRTSVAAADIQTTGLGGDSMVRPAGPGRVEIGPERVVPVSYLASRWPEVRQELGRFLERQQRESVAPEVGDFFVLAGSPEGLSLNRQERRVVELLRERPHSWLALGQACGSSAPQLVPLRRLERIGLIRRSGVTPTDALHVLGTYGAYDVEAAGLGLRAIGAYLKLGEQEAARLIVRECQRRLALAIMRRELTDGEDAAGDGRFEGSRDLLEMILAGDGERGFEVAWTQRRPVVGIGAPIRAFLPGGCRLLGATPRIPPHADVANAIGAATSRVVLTARLRIRPGQFGNYVVFAPDGRSEFPRLEAAEEGARRRVVRLLRGRAASFGTSARQVRVEMTRRTGRLQDGSLQLLEVIVEGRLEGAPDLSRPAAARRLSV